MHRQDDVDGRHVAVARVTSWLRVDWEPQAAARPGPGVAAGVALAAPLLVGLAVGRPEAGAALLLPALLVVLPLPPDADLGERARQLVARVAAVTLAGVYAYLVGGRVWALVPAIVVAAVLGARAPRVGSVAPLAVVLIGIGGPTAAFGVPGLAQLAGGLWGAALMLPRWRRHPSGGPAPPPPRPDRTHLVRLGLTVAAAATLMAAVHHLTGSGHWLVTGTLLALRPTPEGTRAKTRQRVIGNTLGGVVGTLLVLFRPGQLTVALLIGAVGTLAYALRPANYLYWCLAFPMLLLLMDAYREPVPWYTAVVRVALVLAGGLLAVFATRWPRPPAPPPPDV
ncbi:FUSC family protein [Streptomyces lunalinharesii]|uniref:Integral membrane bound transporter domain-containing protein n=1 Tax=Streptomyces lunalinharesii TaxID=333384 RepID=A0ABP6E4A0_9ACTN